MTSIVLKRGATVVFSSDRVNDLSGECGKRLEEDDLPGQTLLDYQDPKTQNRPVNFNCEIFQDEADLLTTIWDLRTETENDYTLYTLEITLNGTTKTLNVLFNKFTWKILSVNSATLTFNMVEANSVMEI